MNQLIKEFNRENLKPIFFIAVAICLLAATAYPQRRFGGRVVEVPDGKTVVVQVPTGGKVTIMLQFIEIPEREQPLYQTVREHLEKLTLGKTVEFLPRRILQTGSVGQIFVDGIDVSRQMLRDGAAWYALPEKSAQEPRDSELYLATETEAKNEKRGVWGVADLKPSWQYRAERQTRALEAEREKLQAAAVKSELLRKNRTVKTSVKQKMPTMQTADLWSEVSNIEEMSKAEASGGLLRGSVPGAGISYTMTAGNLYEFSSADAAARVESRSMYLVGNGANLNGSGFAIAFLAQSEKYSFAESNELTITVDNQKFNLGKAHRLFSSGAAATQEMLVYKIDEKTLTRIANAKTLEVRLGAFSGRLDADYQLKIRNLLALTTY